MPVRAEALADRRPLTPRRSWLSLRLSCFLAVFALSVSATTHAEPSDGRQAARPTAKPAAPKRAASKPKATSGSSSKRSASPRSGTPTAHAPNAATGTPAAHAPNAATGTSAAPADGASPTQATALSTVASPPLGASTNPAPPPAGKAGSSAKPQARTTHRSTARAAKPEVPRAYAQAVARWHTPTPGGRAPLDEAGQPMLALHSLNTRERFVFRSAGPFGGFATSDLDRIARLLREPSSGNQHPIEPRLVDIVYRIQRHFNAEEMRVVSAYRAPRGKRVSNHGRGRAIDVVVPGVRDEDVAAFVRGLGFCGVGIYPKSGFVHVDVRDRSYFWVDTSGPGRRHRERGILGDLARRSDAEARARGELPVAPFVVHTDVDGLLARTVVPATDDAELDDDHEDEDEASESSE